MKIIVFVVCAWFSVAANAGFFWDDRDKYSPEIPTLEAEKPPLDLMPVEQAVFFNDNPQDKAAPIPNGPGCWGPPWPCGIPR